MQRVLFPGARAAEAAPPPWAHALVAGQIADTAGQPALLPTLEAPSTAASDEPASELTATPTPTASATATPTRTPTPRTTATPAATSAARVQATAGAIDADSDAETVTRVRGVVTYYYCEQVAGAPLGDGGGFCGYMRNGTRVTSGAAACDAAYLGQRFRIVGDPTGREYVCADTGSAVGGEHRDIWFATNLEGYEWFAAVGRNVVFEVLP